MADSYIALDEPTTVDKKLDTEQVTVGANTVERERVQLAGAGATDLVLPVAHDAVDAGNALKIGGKASAAAPTDVSADGDRVNAWFLRNGAAAAVLTAAGALIGGDATNGLDVDVTRLPALPAGANNIGDVDVLTVPADPFGANADAAVAAGAAGSIQAKLRRATQGLEDLKSLIVLAAGANAIGKLAANSGVDIGDVDVTTLGGQSPAYNTGARSASTLRVTVATDDLVPVSMATNTPAVATSGGWTPSRTVSAASDNATSVKGSAGQLGFVIVTNVNAAMRYLHFYNKASAPTLGTDVPVLTIPIPGNTAGAGAVFSTWVGVTFTTGIAFACTTTTGGTPASGNTAANDITISLGYK